MRWPESAASRELRVTDAAGDRSLGDVDVVFPILHGRFGEDGTVQGLLELVGLPYVGNGVLASALGMDKHFTKTVLEGAGIEVAPWVTLTRAALAADPELWGRRTRSLGLPVFVKPARAGSSVGVTKVSDWSELDAALEIAFAEDRTVLVESAVVGREIECGVLEGRSAGDVRVSVAGEVVVTGREFYDFEAKYLDAPGVELICPADLGDGELVRAAAHRAARVRGDRRGGARAGRLLPHRRGLRRQRDQHDAGVHADLDVPDLLAELGAQLPRAHRRAHRGRGRARQPLAGVVDARRSRPRPGSPRRPPRGRRAPWCPTPRRCR